MTTSYRSSTSPSIMTEKDNMSTKSTSTIASTVAMIKSTLRSKRYTKSKPTKPRSTESPMSKAEREAIHAEARYYALRWVRDVEDGARRGEVEGRWWWPELEWYQTAMRWKGIGVWNVRKRGSVHHCCLNTVTIKSQSYPILIVELRSLTHTVSLCGFWLHSCVQELEILFEPRHEATELSRYNGMHC